jgi:hypothetical protein
MFMYSRFKFAVHTTQEFGDRSIGSRPWRASRREAGVDYESRLPALACTGMSVSIVIVTLSRSSVTYCEFTHGHAASLSLNRATTTPDVATRGKE